MPPQTTRLSRSSEKNCTFGYLDEAGTSQRYFGCGLLVVGPNVSGSQDESLNRKLRGLKEEAGIAARGDVGWKKVPTKEGKYLQLYHRLIEGFLASQPLSFHALVVDTHSHPIDSKRFFRGSKDAGIDAFAIQLIRSRLLRFWAGGSRLYLRFDRRDRPANQTLSLVSAKLRAHCRSSDTAAPEDLRINARSVTGGRHPLVQLADLLLASAVSPLNAEVKSAGRRAVLDHLTSGLGREPWVPTAPGEMKFNVWRFEAR